MTPSASLERPLENMPSHSLPASFFVRNRQRLQGCLGEHYLALISSGRPPRRTSDEDYPFFANRNFFYLCGIEQENAVILLFRHGAVSREILFLPAQDMMQERWTGRRLRRDQAASRSGLPEVLYLEGFEGVFTDLMAHQPLQLWLDFSAQNPQADEIRTWVDSRHPDNPQSDLAAIFTHLRMIKDPAEIECLQDAIALTGRGIEALMRQVAPGRMEYELWSHFHHALALEGCLSPAFPPIVASGANSLCLHYMTPDSEIKAGDLIQIDVGATAGGLCADISRVFPANGRFSPRQLAVYQLVRSCQEEAFAAIRPGVTLKEINDRCREVARIGLTDLEVIKGDDTVSNYFWHGVCHHLGLDVHDTADRDAQLMPGMVLTVEPGLYITGWGFGIRLEDDVLVTENGCTVLSWAIPREAAEIEAALIALQKPAGSL